MELNYLFLFHLSDSNACPASLKQTHHKRGQKEEVIRSQRSCLESHGERLVAAPVRRQHRAEEVGAVGSDQLAGVVREDVHHVPGIRSGPERPRGGHGAVGVSNFAAGEGCRGRREPSGGGRLYGNMHHNNLGQSHLTGLCEKSRTLWMKKILLS